MQAAVDEATAARDAVDDELARLRPALEGARAEEAAVELGATVPEDQPGETWRVLLDPAGHPFCLTSAANW